MKPSPLENYNLLLKEGSLLPDSRQLKLMKLIDSLFYQFKAYLEKIERPWLKKLFFLNSSFESVEIPKSVYIYGGVGVGKTMIMDLFVKSMKDKVARFHFQELMRDVHIHLHNLREEDGRFGDKLISKVIESLTKGKKVICLDELEIRDIADAMIAGSLFKNIFDRGIVIVATSNRHPNDLYKDGLQREKFLPFIKLISSKTDIFLLDAKRDYRLGRIIGDTVYVTPYDSNAKALLDSFWDRLTDSAEPKKDFLSVNGRKIIIPATAHKVARFDFLDLCDKPLGSSDYFAIAEQFSAVIVDGIPKLGPEKRDIARRFVVLIDALYENRTILICSGDTQPEEIYEGDDWKFEFQRTVSRLMEMQASDYIGKFS